MNGRRYSAHAATILARGMAADDAATFLAAHAEGAQGRRQGAAAQATGQAFEALLERHHARARVLGVADVEHLHPPVLSRGGQPVQFIGRSGVDYQGVLSGGRAVYIEAKSAGRGRLPLVDDGSPRFDGVKRHQRAALDRCVELGGVALLAVRFVRQENRQPVESVYVVPWENVRHLASVGPEDCAGWELAGETYLSRWAA